MARLEVHTSNENAFVRRSPGTPQPGVERSRLCSRREAANTKRSDLWRQSAEIISLTTILVSNLKKWIQKTCHTMEHNGAFAIRIFE
ncbi:hypothetical protein Plhal710r2_c058g0168221 [Plasmopara halstedii]